MKRRLLVTALCIMTTLPMAFAGEHVILISRTTGWAIANYSVQLDDKDVGDYRTTDIVNYSANEYMKTSYDLYRRSLDIGFTYKF